jgi:hypothetical protein
MYPLNELVEINPHKYDPSPATINAYIYLVLRPI